MNAWLAELMVAGLPPPLPSVVTSAPTTRDRRQERGFDHAALLAGHVARRLHRPQRRLLVRDPGAPQTGLAAHARKQGPVIRTCERSPTTVLVVDDVATTGTTLAASAAALRAAGAEHVVAITAARTAPPS